MKLRSRKKTIATSLAVVVTTGILATIVAGVIPTDKVNEKKTKTENNTVRETVSVEGLEIHPRILVCTSNLHALLLNSHHLVKVSRCNGNALLHCKRDNLHRIVACGSAFAHHGISYLRISLKLCGVNIINISQCAEGTVEMARYDTGYQLKNAGVISGYDSTVESAVTKLMHLQGHYSDSNIIRMKMNQNLRGEISLRKEE